MQTGADTSAAYSIPTLPGTSDFYQHPMGVVVVADSEEICDRRCASYKSSGKNDRLSSTWKNAANRMRRRL